MRFGKGRPSSRIWTTSGPNQTLQQIGARPLSRAVLALVTVLCLGGTAAAQSFEWQAATPESQGMSGPKLDALRDELAKRRTLALLVIRNDRIVCEWYAEGVGAGGK